MSKANGCFHVPLALLVLFSEASKVILALISLFPFLGDGVCVEEGEVEVGERKGERESGDGGEKRDGRDKKDPTRR